jgi:hypothetical protein
MNNNPFLASSALNAPLLGDTRARIYYAAMRAAARGLAPESSVLPTGESLAHLRRRIASQGVNGLLAHPAQLDEVFRGVTLAVYREIGALYCSRMARSINMVWEILAAMARHSGLDVQPIDYRAVWSICLYMHDLRSQNLAVLIERAQAEWRLVVLEPDLLVTEPQAESPFAPHIVCVVDLVRSCVLAFRIAREETIIESCSLALYDAIAAQRQPTGQDPSVLSWILPSVMRSTVTLSPECQHAWESLGISLSRTVDEGQGPDIAPLLDALRGKWDRDLSGKVFPVQHFRALFDNYLHRVHGHGPLRWEEERAHKLVHLKAFSRDPAWQFPALLNLLPAKTGRIAGDGTVEYEGLHYSDPLLSYWPGHEVTLKESEHDQTRAWIYMDGEVLCRAKARESNRQVIAARQARVMAHTN